jgi:hypothetical protein
MRRRLPPTPPLDPKQSRRRRCAPQASSAQIEEGREEVVGLMSTLHLPEQVAQERIAVIAEEPNATVAHAQVLSMQLNPSSQRRRGGRVLGSARNQPRHRRQSPAANPDSAADFFRRNQQTMMAA